MYIYSSSPFLSTMARDEVDTSLITTEHRKRKLPSYATNNDNISADKEEIIKRMKRTNDLSNACERSTNLKIDYLLNLISKSIP